MANLARSISGRYQNYNRAGRSNGEKNNAIRASLKPMFSPCYPTTTNFPNKSSDAGNSVQKHQLLKLKYKILDALQNRLRCRHVPFELLLLT